MQIPKYIVFRVDVMRKGTSVELTNITDDVEDVILKAEQTEPNCSEIQNNCEAKNYCDDCLYTDTCDSKAFFYACTSKATISKMEQVDEPKTDCNGCKFVGTYDTEFPCANCSRKTKDYYAKDEPQAETHDLRTNTHACVKSSLEPFRVDCDTCRYRDEPSIKCDRCDKAVHNNYEPQTESLKQFRVGLEYHTDTTHFGKVKGESITTNKVEDDPQTEIPEYEAWKEPFETDCSWK